MSAGPAVVRAGFVEVAADESAGDGTADNGYTVDVLEPAAEPVAHEIRVCPLALELLPAEARFLALADVRDRDDPPAAVNVGKRRVEKCGRGRGGGAAVLAVRGVGVYHDDELG